MINSLDTIHALRTISALTPVSRIGSGMPPVRKQAQSLLAQRRAILAEFNSTRGGPTRLVTGKASAKQRVVGPSGRTTPAETLRLQKIAKAIADRTARGIQQDAVREKKRADQTALVAKTRKLKAAMLSGEIRLAPHARKQGLLALVPVTVERR